MMSLHSLRAALVSISLFLPGLLLLSERHLVEASCPDSSDHYPLTTGGCECMPLRGAPVPCIVNDGMVPEDLLYLECKGLPALVKEDNFTEFIGCL